MQRTFLISLSLAAATLASAHLAPGTDAPLYQHMMEVNHEWRTMDPSLAYDQRTVHFNSDAERIAMHLHLVRSFLGQHRAGDVPAAASAKRAALLNTLEQYADRGLFPQNHAKPFRTPVFIDAVGTACAVGHLMIASGHDDLARRIDDEMELAYVHDMHRADVDQWAVAHGFTENELAWIQPAYAPAQPWSALGGGTNGEVTTLLKLVSGDLLVAGSFTQAGTVTTNVARWDGSLYHALGTLPGTASCAIERGGILYLGGSFNNFNDLAKWNGSTWTYETAFPGKTSYVSALHVHEGELFAAGASSGFAGMNYGVARLYDGTWEAVGTNFNAPVNALGSHNGQLVCGGAFTYPVGGPTDPVFMHVATFNTNWTQLGDGLDAEVRAFTNLDGALYAGGELFEGATEKFGLASLGDGAANWEMLLPNHQYLFSAMDGSAYISTLTINDGDVFFGGAFHIDGLMYYGSGLGRYNGAPTDITPMAGFNSRVNAFASMDNILIAGGLFTENNFAALPYIASTDLSTGMADLQGSSFKAWPNPASDVLTITSATTPFNATNAQVMDATGRVVLNSALNGTRVQLDVKSLASGTYTALISNGNQRHAVRFVKN